MRNGIVPANSTEENMGTIHRKSVGRGGFGTTLANTGLDVLRAARAFKPRLNNRVVTALVGALYRSGQS